MPDFASEQEQRIDGRHHAERMLRITEVASMTGLSAPSIWRLCRDGLFPKPRRLGPRARGWLESEVVAHLRALPQLDSAA